jgi:DNA helicase IV
MLREPVPDCEPDPSPDGAAPRGSDPTLGRSAAAARSTRAAELATEQAYVDVVYDRIGQLRSEADATRAERITAIDPDNPGSIYERDVVVHGLDERLRILEQQGEGIVFGRLDNADGRIWRIGRIGVRTGASDILVVDWRAPAAAPFYRATQQHPLGVARRRVITSRGDRVLDIDDDVIDAEAADRLGLPAVGEGALMTALTRERSHHMRDIVATIQREQDEAIRAPAAGVTRIEGGPGTGKTVVALHRAAYLLHENRERYRWSGVLVVGPTTVFSRYIERVLPSLGETSATLRSIGELATGLRATRYDDDAAPVKGSLRMARIL